MAFTLFQNVVIDYIAYPRITKLPFDSKWCLVQQKRKQEKIIQDRGWTEEWEKQMDLSEEKWKGET